MYKNKFEFNISNFFDEEIPYESDIIKYTVPETVHKYKPDFTIEKGKLYLETKGIWDGQDRKKHIYVKEQHPDITVILLFQNSRLRISKKSKVTYGEWCDKKGIPWFCMKYKLPPKTIKQLKQYYGNK